MHYLEIGLRKAMQKELLNPKVKKINDLKKKIAIKFWGDIPRAKYNIDNLIDGRTTVKDAHIQGFCDEFNLSITFSPNNEPKVENYEKGK